MGGNFKPPLRASSLLFKAISLSLKLLLLAFFTLKLSSCLAFISANALCISFSRSSNEFVLS